MGPVPYFWWVDTIPPKNGRGIINWGSRRYSTFSSNHHFLVSIRQISRVSSFLGSISWVLDKISVGWIRKFFLDVIYELFKYDMWICYIPLGPSWGISPAVFRMTCFRDELFELKSCMIPFACMFRTVGGNLRGILGPSSGWWSMMVRVVHFLFRFMGSSRLYSAMALPGRCLTPVAESERYSGTGGFLGGLVASSHSGCPSLGGTKLDVNIGWFGEIWCWVVLGNVWAKTLFNMEPPSKIRILEIAGDSDSFWISTNRLQVFSIPQSLGIRGKMPLAATTSIKWSDDKCTIPKQTVLLKKRQWTQIFLFHWQP